MMRFLAVRGRAGVPLFSSRRPGRGPPSRCRTRRRSSASRSRLPRLPRHPHAAEVMHRRPRTSRCWTGTAWPAMGPTSQPRSTTRASGSSPRRAAAAPRSATWPGSRLQGAHTPEGSGRDHEGEAGPPDAHPEPVGAGGGAPDRRRGGLSMDRGPLPDRPRPRLPRRGRGGAVNASPAADAPHVPHPDRARPARRGRNVHEHDAMAPGHLGATARQRRDLAASGPGSSASSRPRSRAASSAGSPALHERARLRQLVPLLILLASALAVQERLRAWLLRRLAPDEATTPPPLGGGRGARHPSRSRRSIYGGYFGRGSASSSSPRSGSSSTTRSRA